MNPGRWKLSVKPCFPVTLLFRAAPNTVQLVSANSWANSVFVAVFLQQKRQVALLAPKRLTFHSKQQKPYLDEEGLQTDRHLVIEVRRETLTTCFVGKRQCLTSVPQFNVFGFAESFNMQDFEFLTRQVLEGNSFVNAKFWQNIWWLFIFWCTCMHQWNLNSHG